MHSWPLLPRIRATSSALSAACPADMMLPTLPTACSRAAGCKPLALAARSMSAGGSGHGRRRGTHPGHRIQDWQAWCRQAATLTVMSYNDGCPTYGTCTARAGLLVHAAHAHMRMRADFGCAVGRFCPGSVPRHLLCPLRTDQQTWCCRHCQRLAAGRAAGCKPLASTPEPCMSAGQVADIAYDATAYPQGTRIRRGKHAAAKPPRSLPTRTMWLSPAMAAPGCGCPLVWRMRGPCRLACTRGTCAYGFLRGTGAIQLESPTKAPRRQKFWALPGGSLAAREGPWPPSSGVGAPAQGQQRHVCCGAWVTRGRQPRGAAWPQGSPTVSCAFTGAIGLQQHAAERHRPPVPPSRPPSAAVCRPSTRPPHTCGPQCRHCWAVCPLPPPTESSRSFKQTSSGTGHVWHCEGPLLPCLPHPTIFSGWSSHRGVPVPSAAPHAPLLAVPNQPQPPPYCKGRLAAPPAQDSSFSDASSLQAARCRQQPPSRLHPPRRGRLHAHLHLLQHGGGRQRVGCAEWAERRLAVWQGWAAAARLPSCMWRRHTTQNGRAAAAAGAPPAASKAW